MEEQHQSSARFIAKKNIRKLKRQIPEAEDIGYLNITPMMDMMTILLVFFLKSMSVSQEIITLNDDLMLPASNSQIRPQQAVQITLTRKSIVVEGDLVAAVKNGAVDASVKRNGSNDYLISPLESVLKKHATRLRKIEKMTSGRMKFKGEVVIVADQTLPYRLISEVLYTAGQAEYGRYRLLVLKR